MGQKEWPPAASEARPDTNAGSEESGYSQVLCTHQLYQPQASRHSVEYLPPGKVAGYGKEGMQGHTTTMTYVRKEALTCGLGSAHVPHRWYGWNLPDVLRISCHVACTQHDARHGASPTDAHPYLQATAAPAWHPPKRTDTPGVPCIQVQPTIASGTSTVAEN